MSDSGDFDKPDQGPVKRDKGRKQAPGIKNTYGYITKSLDATNEMLRENLFKPLDNGDELGFSDPSKQTHHDNVKLSLNKKGRWNLAEEILDRPDSFRGPYDKVAVVKNEKWALSGTRNSNSDRTVEYHEFAEDEDNDRHRYAKSAYSREGALKDKTKQSARRRRRGANNDEDEPVAPEPQESKIEYEISVGCTRQKCREADINGYLKNMYKMDKPRDTGRNRKYEDLRLEGDDEWAYERREPHHMPAGVSGSGDDDEFFEARSTFFEADLLDAIPFAQAKSIKKRGKKAAKKAANEASAQDAQSFVDTISSESTSGDSDADAAGSGFEVIEPSKAPTVTLQFLPQMPRVTLVVPTAELEPLSLIDKFGDSYKEVACIPRIFSISIDEKLKSELTDAYGTDGMKLTVRAQVNFLVLPAKDSPHRLETDQSACQVWINCLVADHVMSTEFNTVWAGDIFTMYEIVERASCCLSLLPLESFVPRDQQMTGQTSTYLSAVRRMEPDMTCVPQELASESFLRTSVLHSLQRQITAVQRYMDESEERQEDQLQYCNVCYTDLCPTSGAFALAGCEHWFCLECWQNYLGQQVFQGSLNIRCPEYDCDSTVPVSVLPLVLPQRFCTVHMNQVRDYGVSGTAHGIWTWCISPKCQRLLKVEEEGKGVNNQYMACVCGSKWCPRCLHEPHYPASCKVNEMYEKQLENFGDKLSLKERRQTINFVSVKHCKMCTTPMEKGFGCNHMVCRCGHQFCWACLGNWDTVKGYEQHSKCGTNSKRGFEEIFLVDVITKGQLINKKNYAKCVYHRHERDTAKLRDIRVALEKKVSGNAEMVESLRELGLLSRVHKSANGTYSKNHIIHFLVSYFRQSHYLLEFVNVWIALNKRHPSLDIMRRRASQAIFFVERLKEACLYSPTSKVLESLGHLDHEISLFMKSLSKLDSEEAFDDQPGPSQ